MPMAVSSMSMISIANYEEYDPNFTTASLDEAYVDITKVCKERNITGGEVAKELRENVYEVIGLTCSVGVATSRLLAKVCSDINKPNGQFVLPNDRAAIMTFISSLPIRKIGGSFLCALFSPSSVDIFISVGLGLGGIDAPQVRSRKSMSNERTFFAIMDETFFHQKLFELAEMLSADMEKEGLYGQTLTLKLKTASFEVRTRAVTLQSNLRSSQDLLKHASKLLKAELPVSVMRMSISMKIKELILSKEHSQSLLNREKRKLWMKSSQIGMK